MTDFAFGPEISEEGVLFRLWAPKHPNIELVVENNGPVLMDHNDAGWHTCAVSGAANGTRYEFVMPDGLKVPDPASRYQPRDVHGPSEVVDLRSFGWANPEWKGRPWEETVLYELHIGTFTAEGSFKAAIERLDHLRDLGITTIQIMPLADFRGQYNWGYDGVLPYAPDSSYGRPEELMALVDAAHQRGISVFLDVVYNHFGPDGNYFSAYAPLFTERHQTPWGAGINYDGEQSHQVREFIIQNAIYWVTVFRFDGLRLDAVHAIQDDSGEHILLELTRRVRAAAGERFVHIVAENENNDAKLLERNGDDRPKCFTAQWNDDIHHVLHIAVTGERFAYYGDYDPGPLQIGRALAEGFVFQGEHMPYRDEPRGSPSSHLPPTCFVSFIQNHDQIGNRAMGDRMAASRPAEALKAVAAVYLLAPQIPMLFMGEEWGAKEPFPYFCDFDEELNQKVRDGRKRELSRLPGFDAANALDPTARATFEAAKLDWNRLEEAAELLEFYRGLLRLRLAEIVPRLKSMGHVARYDMAAPLVEVEWRARRGFLIRLTANLSGRPVKHEVGDHGKTLFATGEMTNDLVSPWAVRWSIRNSD